MTIQARYGGSSGSSRSPPRSDATSTSSSHGGSKGLSVAENSLVVRRIFDAFARKDGLALRGLFAEDAVWRVPGTGAMAGAHEGREAIFRFLGRLAKETNGTYGSELVDVLASGSRAAALYRATGSRRGRTLELDQVLLFSFADGLVREVLALPTDPATFESFWARLD
jgi:ketosteroid isomerase-like protein